MRLIDADALLKAMGTWDKFGFSHSGAFVREPKNDDYVPYVHYEDMKKCVEGMPTIDAVPVVRCKDCKHRPIDTGGHNYGQDLFFPDEDNVCPCQCGDTWYSWMPGDYWFCGNGERREDETN